MLWFRAWPWFKKIFIYVYLYKYKYILPSHTDHVTLLKTFTHTHYAPIREFIYYYINLLISVFVYNN